MHCTQLVCHVLVHNLASFPSLPSLLAVVILYILSHVGQCNTGFRVMFWMLQVCFKPIMWYIEMHHVRIFFLCGTITVSYYVVFTQHLPGLGCSKDNAIPGLKVNWSTYFFLNKNHVLLLTLCEV